MAEEQYVKNNTLFSRTTKKLPQERFVRNVVFISSDNIKQNVLTMLEEPSINTIRLTSHFYKKDDLDFLKSHDLSFIKSIDILSDSVKNVDGLYALGNLEEIYATNLDIDYSRFPNLKEIATDEDLTKFSYKSLERVNCLEHISILNKFKLKDLSVFKDNISLKYITLRGSNITSLKGLENFLCLETLNLFHNRSLESLDGITSNHKKLKYIDIIGCKKLFYFNDYLSELENLETIQFDNQMIDSFKFLDKLQSLKGAYIHNLVQDAADGDKEPLMRALNRTNGQIWEPKKKKS